MLVCVYPHYPMSICQYVTHTSSVSLSFSLLLQQQYMFLLHSEQERENWLSSIKKLQPKGWSLSPSPSLTHTHQSLCGSFGVVRPQISSHSLSHTPTRHTHLYPAVRSVSFNTLELQDLLNHQTISELRKIEEVTLPVLGQSLPFSLSPSLSLPLKTLPGA